LQDANAVLRAEFGYNDTLQKKDERILKKMDLLGLGGTPF